MTLPRILISALRGGSGKTIVSLGLIAAWRKRGLAVAPFKKGPDFIDAGWLALAAGRPCHNLDTFLASSDRVLLSFKTRAACCDVSVVEGNRGLYDGLDVEGSTSTAEMAKLLEAPVVLIVDCTKSTRTVAAAVLGCLHFDPAVGLAGVILNRVAGRRHEAILREAVGRYCNLPVVGAIPKMKEEPFPERHMGLVPTPEHDWAEGSIEKARETAERYLDLESLLRIARQAPELAGRPIEVSAFEKRSGDECADSKPRIGVIRDSAFQFYYPENFEALEGAGAELVFVNALADSALPELDGLYVGGGFPETHAKALADNKGFRGDLRNLAEQGAPIYAECGGLMYLGESLSLESGVYPMVGVFPVVFGFHGRPQGHGYTVFEVEKENPYFKTATLVRGHEFHYSRVLSWHGEAGSLAFRMVRGEGIHGGRDGACYKQTLATYMHIHALGAPSWAGAVVRAAASYRKSRGAPKQNAPQSSF